MSHKIFDQSRRPTGRPHALQLRRSMATASLSLSATQTTTRLASILSCCLDYPPVLFQQKLRTAFAEVVVACSKNCGAEGVGRLDGQVWRSGLTAIDWKQLCRLHHRHHAQKHKGLSSVKDESPLHLLLECFSDTELCPGPLLAAVFDVSWSTLLIATVNDDDDDDNGNCFVSNKKNFPSEWKPASKLLLKFMTEFLLQRHPFMQGAPFLLEHAAIGKRVRTTKEAETVLRAIHFWFNEIPSRRAVWITKIMELIAVLDALEDSMRQQFGKHSSGASDRNDKSATSITNTRRRKQKDRRSMQLLHGELSEDQEAAYVAQLGKCRRVVVGELCTNPSVRSLQYDGGGTDINIGAWLVDLWRVKAKCIKSLLKLCCKAKSSWSTTKPIPRCCDVISSVLSQYLNVVVHRHPNSVTLRLCGIFLAESMCGEKVEASGRICVETTALHYHPLVSLALSEAIRETRYDAICCYLRMYSEWISECSYFDSESHLYAAIVPLLHHITQLTPGLISERKMRAVTNPFLQCFAFLLTRRGRMILSLAQKPEYGALNTCISHLSLVLDQPSDWLHHTMVDNECHEEKLEALQMIGILGFGCKGQSRDDTVDNRIESNREIATDLIPPRLSLAFPLLLIKDFTSLQTVYERLESWMVGGPTLVVKTASRSLFSNYSATNAIPNPVHATTTVLISEPLVCLTDQLNDDLISHVLSFLNYKRLVRVRLVCSNWKRLSDNARLWRDLYHSRFGTTTDCSNGVFSRNGTGSSLWQQLFVERWQAERAIRFRVCSVDSSWKVRLCGHVGCLTVLATPSAATRHSMKHQRQTKSKMERKHRPCKRGRSSSSRIADQSLMPTKKNQTSTLLHIATLSDAMN